MVSCCLGSDHFWFENLLGTFGMGKRYWTPVTSCSDTYRYACKSLSKKFLLLMRCPTTHSFIFVVFRSWWNKILHMLLLLKWAGQTTWEAYEARQMITTVKYYSNDIMSTLNPPYCQQSTTGFLVGATRWWLNRTGEFIP